MKRVLVIFGGMSSEHEVSLRSAQSVLEAIDREKYEVLTLGITKDGRWLYYSGPTEWIVSGKWETSFLTQSAVLSCDARDHGLILLEPEKPISPSQRLTQEIAGLDNTPKGARAENHAILPVDVIFPVLHGKYGEDGTLQGLLDISGIPYVGCGVAASANCMDKDITHRLLESAGIAMTPYVCMTTSQIPQLNELRPKIEEKLGYPMFIKPSNAGSSVGVSKVEDPSQLVTALQIAFEEDSKVILEAAVVGKEIECAVMGNEIPEASKTLAQIIPPNGIYDYTSKYLDDSAKFQIPASLSEEEVAAVRETALRAYQVMGCSGLSRVDFFVTENHSIFLNEINTLPGFTSISMFPRLFAEEGVDMTQLIDHLIDYALGVNF